MVRIKAGRLPQTNKYWEFKLDLELIEDGAFDRYQDLIENALRSSLASVGALGSKVGVLLSGGVDSSLLTALAVQELDSCVAYTARIAGFDNFELDRAEVVTAHLGMEHHVVDIDPTRFVEDLPYIVRRMEELPRHPNNLVLAQLLREASTEVDIILQGDAADTLLGGRFIHRLRKYTRKRNLVRGLPPWLLQGPIRVLERIPNERAWDAARVLAWNESRYLHARDAIRYRSATRRAIGLSHLDSAAWNSGDWRPDQDLEELRRGHLVSSGIQGSLIRHDRLSCPEGLLSLAPFLSPEMVKVALRMPRELRGGEVSNRYCGPFVIGSSRPRCLAGRREDSRSPGRNGCLAH